MLAGCQGGYPLAPTVCDDWCEASKGLMCFPDEPAACVASCETQGFSSTLCEASTRAAVDCMRAHPTPPVDCQETIPLPDPACIDVVGVASNCILIYEQSAGSSP